MLCEPKHHTSTQQQRRVSPGDARISLSGYESEHLPHTKDVVVSHQSLYRSKYVFNQAKGHHLAQEQYPYQRKHQLGRIL